MIAMGSLEGALRSLDWLAAFEPAVVVPGHGPLVTDGFADVLDTHRRYYELIRDTAVIGREKGWTPLQAAQEKQPQRNSLLQFYLDNGQKF